jgi:hypothetical protein
MPPSSPIVFILPPPILSGINNEYMYEYMILALNKNNLPKSQTQLTDHG